MTDPLIWLLRTLSALLDLHALRGKPIQLILRRHAHFEMACGMAKCLRLIGRTNETVFLTVMDDVNTSFHSWPLTERGIGDRLPRSND